MDRVANVTLMSTLYIHIYICIYIFFFKDFMNITFCSTVVVNDFTIQHDAMSKMPFVKIQRIPSGNFVFTYRLVLCLTVFTILLNVRLQSLFTNFSKMIADVRLRIWCYLNIIT